MASLPSLLKESSPDPEEVVNACNAALKQSKSDGSAQHAKTVALLKLDRYKDAVEVFEEFGTNLQTRAAFEYAYALYKTGQLDKAREVVRKLKETEARHLEAQVSYLLEDFANASAIYHELWASRDADEETDLRLNIGATDAQLQWARQGDLVSKKDPGREDLEAFETAYNAACGCIARGELGKGEVLLKRAKDLCVSFDQLSDDIKQDELLPITLQQLYVLATLGKTEQAVNLLKELSVTSTANVSTRLIAQMNKTCTTADLGNPFLIRRQISYPKELPNNDRFFAFQESTIKQNMMALDLLSSKYRGVADSTARQIPDSSMPTSSPRINTISSINAAAHAQCQLGKIGLKSVVPLLEKRPKDVGLLATIIQLYVMTNNYGAAVTVLDAFLKRLEESQTDADQDVRHAPGLVAITVSLYSKVGRTSHVQTELAKAASYWRHKSKCPPELLRVAGFSLLNSSEDGDLREAGKIFETLYQRDNSDRFAKAGLVASYAQTNLRKIELEADKLPAVNRLISGIDVDALESAGIPQSSNTISAILSGKVADNNAAKSVKKRKNKLAKYNDPSKKPDPEGWLPLRDRSTYKPKGKKGKQKQAALTQGGLEKAQVQDTQKVNPPLTGSGGGSGGGSGKSKKKKGKK